MADTNHNGKLDADELEETVEEEEMVADAFQEDKITKEEASRIDDLDDLEKEADKIKMTEAMGKPSQTESVSPSDIQVSPVTTEDTPKAEDVPNIASTPKEAVRETVSEKSSEPASEASFEPKEIIQEIKKPMI